MIIGADVAYERSSFEALLDVLWEGRTHIVHRVHIWSNGVA